ncbi:MAG: Wzz/FepE/Etk N-terminal domain-containing protein [Balneolaceae bacterium]
MSPRDKEYRLIPYDSDDREDQIEVAELGRILWNARKKILLVMLAFAVYGAFRSLAAPEEFTSAATITPVIEQQTQLPSFLQQFSGMIGGTNLSAGAADQIQVQLYPEIIFSSGSMYNLIHQPIEVASLDSSVTVMDYMTVYREQSMLSRVTGTLLDYTIHLPFTLIKHAYSLFRYVLSFVIGEAPEMNRAGSAGQAAGGPTTGQDSVNVLSEVVDPDNMDEIDPDKLARELDLDAPIRMTVDEANFVDEMTDRITTELGAETGLFRIEVQMPDPEIAAQVNQRVLDYLTAYVINYRTEKSLRNLNFISERNEIAKEEYLEAQRELSEFQDSNLGMLNARARAEEQRLNSEFQLRFDLYNVLRQRLEEARIQVEEQTPVFNFMDPVSVPPGRSSPRRVLMVVLYTLVGGVLSVFWLFMRHAFRTESGSGQTAGQ